MDNFTRMLNPCELEKEEKVGAKWTEGRFLMGFIKIQMTDQLITSSNCNHSLKWLCIFFPSLFIMSNVASWCKLTLNDWILNLVALSKTMQSEQRCSLHDNNCSCQT
ncbi:hypothetical protein T01_3234 [Trichinella spiralis]|uniref:Uncharacterized protein n=1 Tax=Trichinella spiralis TaxID=6334 RepID=A0A0V1BTR2_TRISP|nr:hypothetical protein T01_3234 [Trichinella spiralis]